MKRAIILLAMLAAGIAHGQMFAQMFSATSTGRLPSEYQEVEYLESNFTQYILPNVGAVTTNSSYSLKFVILGVTNANNGIWGSASTPRYAAFSPILNTDILSTFYGGNTTRNVAIGLNKVVVWNQNKSVGSYTIDGTPGTLTYADTADNTDNKFRLFSIGGFNTGSKIRLYYFTFTTGATLNRNMIPARRKADGVLGMWDLVGSAFYVNQGTGTFKAGADIN